MKIELDLKGAFFADQVFIVAPMLHETKGIGYVVAPITREVLDSECGPILDIVDSAINYYAELREDDE